MARDEALLHCVANRDLPAAMRFYEWSEPTISLGYFQAYAEYQALRPPAGALPVVRRTTGGGAILHDRELTYSIVVPADLPPFSKQPDRLYELAHAALIECLHECGLAANLCGHTDDSRAGRGPFFCFERRHRLDVLIDQHKLAGSAQRRTRQAILQHGSIITERRFEQHPTVSPPPNAIQAATLQRAFAQAFAGRINGQIKETPWTEAMLTLAAGYEKKYAEPGWTRRK